MFVPPLEPLEAGEPLDVGRKTRSIPPALRRALRSRDRGCRFPGCTHTRFVDGHHIHHWADGGETRMDNLVLLCRRHHVAVHEEGYRIELQPDGAARFFHPSGDEIEAAPSPSCDAALSDPLLIDFAARLAVRADPWTGSATCDDAPVDYWIALDAMRPPSEAEPGLSHPTFPRERPVEVGAEQWRAVR